MSGRVLIIEGGTRVGMLAAVLEWCVDETMEIQIDMVEKGKDDVKGGVGYNVLDQHLHELRAFIGNLKELDRGGNDQ